jgi:hypothetical protein
MARKDDRVSFLKEILFEWSAGQGNARISDLSAGGCYIDTIVTVSPGELIAFDIRADDGTTMRFTGSVAHVIPGMGFGVEFNKLSPECKEFLDRVLPPQD